MSRLHDDSITIDENDMNEKQREEFCAHALIPQTASLEFSHFEEFYEQRKALMAQRIRNLLAAPELAG